MTTIPASKVKPPLIAECPINLECKVIRIFVCLVVINAIGSGSINEAKANDEEIGDHDMFTRFTNAKGLWFVGEVIAEHVDEEILDERGRLQVEKLDGLCYVLSEYWSLGQKLGYHGFSRHIK